MNFEEFQEVFKNNYWFSEFQNEFKCLDNETLEKLYNKIKENTKENEKLKINGLYSFALLLYGIIYTDWKGFLSPKLIYLGSKILVLMGLTQEAKNLTRGFEFDPGCSAWRLASYYRNSDDLKRSKEFLELKNRVLNYLETGGNSDELITNDLITWIIASLPIQECFEFYEKKRLQITKILPLVILFEKLINNDIKKATLIVNEMNKFENLTEFEKILANNKRAVLFQLKGDQKEALNYFETASELASKLKDYFNLSKISFNKGSSYYLLGDYELSLLSYQQAESSYNMIQDTTGLGKVYNSLASIYHAIGEYTIAEKYIMLTKKIFETTENTAMKNGINYKYASILYSRGCYQRVNELLYPFSPKTESILNFEIQLLKISAQFELNRTFDECEIENLLKMSEKLEYNVGKGNLYFYWAKMVILQGNIIEGELKLNLAYETFQQVNFIRGIILTLNLYAFIEMIKGKIETAESYCSTSLMHSKNSHLYLEELESTILLSNIFFIKGDTSKSINLIDTVLFSLNSRQMKNNLFLQALFLKSSFELQEDSIYLPSLREFMKVANNSGSLYWDQQSRLVEAQQFLLVQDYQNAISIAQEVFSNSENFEIRILAKKIYFKGLIGSLTIKKQKESYDISDLCLKIESELQVIKKNLIKNGLTIKIIEYEMIEIFYNEVANEKININSKLNGLKELIENSHLNYLNIELQKLEQPNQKNKSFLSNPSIEVELLIK